MPLHPLCNHPIIHVDDSPLLMGNVNGPALIRNPTWANNSLGRYLLYFAHHEGRSIRLASAEALTGPWTLVESGALQLEHSGFVCDAPAYEDVLPAVQQFVDLGHDGLYAHIASPDVIVDHEQQQIRMYYHGRRPDGLQTSRVAVSADGVHFEVVEDEVVPHPYLRVFQHENAWYGIAMPGAVYHSADGLAPFTTGHQLLDRRMRHCALLKRGNTLFVAWTQVGHAPERILLSTVDLSGDWKSWAVSEPVELHRPTQAWEGADLLNQPSQYGGIMHPVNQLRDPAFFEEDDQLYLLYSVAGEQGIGIGQVQCH